MRTTRKRVLPADVYDALELAAESEGGVGRGSVGPRYTPVCAYGLASFAEDSEPHKVSTQLYYSFTPEMPGPVSQALFDAGISYAESDNAVARINQRRDCMVFARVPFADWCAELGVERGE